MINKNNLNWYKILKVLVPTRRYLNNDGIRQSFKILKKYYPNLDLLIFNKNEKCGLWTIPVSWDVIKGKLLDPKGKKIADYKDHPLHLFSNSVSFSGKIKLDKLLNHIFTDKTRPTLIPFHFRNTFRENVKEWGFSIPHNKKKKLKKGNYTVQIKTKFSKKDMHSAYLTHKGKSSETLLLTSHFDHPFQANDGISGTVASYEVIKSLKNLKTKITYSALATPEIIGSLFFAKKFAKKKNIKQALMVSFAGVKANLVYSKSSKEDAFIDKAMMHILRFKEKKAKIVKFRELIGADEIAYDNVIHKIPCGSLQRGPYKFYHSNKDTIENVDINSFSEHCNILKELIYIIENNCIFYNKFKNLPKLSHPKINLYISSRIWEKKDYFQLDDSKSRAEANEEFSNVLNLIKNDDLIRAIKKNSHNIEMLKSLIPTKADGKTSCLELADACNMPFAFVNTYLDLWEKKKLIVKKWVNPFSSKY